MSKQTTPGFIHQSEPGSSNTSLPPRLSELVILTTARWQKSEAEWAIHEPLARKVGLPGEQIEALQSDRRPVFTEAVEEATLQRLLSRAGNKAAIEITGLCGCYPMVTMTLNASGSALTPLLPRTKPLNIKPNYENPHRLLLPLRTRF